MWAALARTESCSWDSPQFMLERRDGGGEGVYSEFFPRGCVWGTSPEKYPQSKPLLLCFFQPSKVRAPSTLIPPSPSPEPLTTGSGRGRSMVRGRFSALKKGLVHSGWGIGTKSGLQPGTHSGFLSLVSPDQPEPHSPSGSQGGVRRSWSSLRMWPQCDGAGGDQGPASWDLSWEHFSGSPSLTGRGGYDGGWLSGSGVQGSSSTHCCPGVQGTGHSMNGFCGILRTTQLAGASSCQPSRAALRPGLLTEPHCSPGAP